MSDWYYLVDGQQQGPVSVYALKGHILAQQFPADILVWQEGMPAWFPANSLAAFAAPPPAPVLPPSVLKQTSEKEDRLADLGLPITLKQKKRVEGTRIFELSREYLTVTINEGGDLRRDRLLLTNIMEEAHVVTHTDWGSLVLSVPLLISGVAVIGAGVEYGPPILYSIGGCFLAIAGMLLVSMKLRVEKSLEFITQTNAIVIWVNYPNKSTFNQFISKLETVLELINRRVTVE